MKKSFISLFAVAGLLLAPHVASAAVLADFQGPFAPANWTTTISDGGGVNTTGAPASISLTGSDVGSEVPNFVDFTIAAPSSGVVQFSWDYFSSDSFESAAFDPFGYLLNGNFTQLTGNSSGVSQSGTESFNVLLGDVFGFRQFSTDSIEGAATTTVSNFSVTDISAVPEPGSVFALGLLISGGLVLRSRRSVQAIN